MSWAMQVLLLLSVFLNVTSFYVFNMLGSAACFETVEITTDYRGPPLNGSFLKFIKPFGWAGIGLQVASWILYQVFAAMLSAKAEEIQKNGSFATALPTVGMMGPPIESMALQTNAVAWGGLSSNPGRSIARAGTLPAPASQQVPPPSVRVCV